jgi:hypothetical protein
MNVRAGSTYWVGLLAEGGSLYLRNARSGGCRSRTVSRHNMRCMPASWSGAQRWSACRISAYVSGAAADAGTAPPATALQPPAPPASPAPGLTTPPTLPVLSAPANTAAPAVTGNTYVGQTLTSTTGSWTGSPVSYTYQWEDCDASGSNCSDILAAVSNSYKLSSTDVGHSIRAVVTAVNLGGATSASSAATAVVTASAPPGAPSNTAVPVVSGSAQQGQTLTTSRGSWSGSPTSYAYQWQACDSSGASCANIGGATSSSYTLGAGDVGHTIRSVVTASNAGGSNSASSAATGTVTSSSGGGSTGCFASPGACGYPDPSARNVGATAPCSSLPASGSITVSTAGQTIQNLNVTGTITVNAANVTINNVCVTDNGGGQLGTRAILLGSGAKNALIEHVTIAGANQSNQSIEQAIANNSASTATLQYGYLYNCGECVWNGPWTVSDSYVITNGMQGTSDHLEDIYLSDSTATLNHDVLLDPSWQNSTIFGDTQWGGGGPCDNHWTITNSLLAGGGFVIYTCGNASSAGSSTMNISNNRFARCTTGPFHYNASTGGTACQGATQEQIGAGADSHGYWPDGGYFGIKAWTYCTGTAQVWAANVWDDNGAAAACA